ncbi:MULTISPECIES: DUF58 domain-containing protein [Nocardiopsidaceae]|uniref:DUF58 domain-containing protein n=1 Tax=Streptomonospora nanhaiensis TaxID=1323731 RepID=A0ABY6YNQ9_9ACTN|nr:DUF58 domain-containing protein [Streptomonospora nanhaiensis]WAE73899.1 DUF58 domain-containing protein [Streptomonospora nanhaiensis]
MPTVRGWLVAGAGLVLLTVGVVSQYQELALLGGVAVTAVAAASLVVGRPAAVAVRRSLPSPRTSPGSALRVRLEMRNPGRRSVGVVEPVRGHGGERPVRLPSLGARAAGGAEYRVLAARRGVVSLGPLRVGRADPLGLAAVYRESGGADRVWVHPRWERLRTVPVGRVADPEGTADGAPAGAQTFHSLRDYVPGDDLRLVHWRSSARLDKLVVREYIDTSQPRLHVIVDDRPTAGGEDRLDEVASAAASVLATGVQASLHCEVSLVSGRGRDSTGGLPPLLDLLAEARPAPDADLPQALRLARTRPSGDTAVLVSGALTTADLRSFGELGHHYSALVAVTVGAEDRPSAPAPVTLLAAGDAAGFVERWNETSWPR